MNSEVLDSQKINIFFQKGYTIIYYIYAYIIINISYFILFLGYLQIYQRCKKKIFIFKKKKPKNKNNKNSK
jgi:hypothetical protein